MSLQNLLDLSESRSVKQGLSEERLKEQIPHLRKLISFYREYPDYLVDFITIVVEKLGGNTDFVYALPTAIMKPLSGSGARAMMLDTFNAYGVDSFAGFASSIIQGSTETTFYVLAVYFGAVKINNTRSALPLALLADVIGIISAILLAYMFYQ